MNMKKLFLLNLPYLLFVYPFDKLAQAFRLAPGANLSGKLLSIGDGFTAAFSSPWLSFHPTDLLIGIAGAVVLRMAVYLKGKNAKKYRHGIEYGSARWGTAADIAPYMDKDFFQNIPMTQTERITMASRPKQPKYARNKNILVIGGSGSGKTRFFCKPSLLQAHSSYVCTDPKGTLLPEIGAFLERKKYRIKCLNLINFRKYSKVPVGKLCTTQHRINEDVVLSLVSEMLKAIAEYAKHDRAEFVRVVQEAQSSQQTAEVKKQRTRLATAKQRVSELEVLLCKIYEDNILGKLSDSRYATLDAQYEKEQSELTVEISDLEKAIKSYEKHEKDADRFIALIDKYENFDKLTIAMLNEFIEKILVHERDRKGSIQTTQEVEIYFNFVGRFVPPAFGEVELTPEELEEIRKREERKDRLHQNYLKRKASGAQKRYEDKIKGRKKAEIEAKKAAIRAEDIAKGVFVPVSSLPQREPMKGVQTA